MAKYDVQSKPDHSLTWQVINCAPQYDVQSKPDHTLTWLVMYCVAQYDHLSHVYNDNLFYICPLSVETEQHQ